MRRRIGSPDPFELAHRLGGATGTARTSSSLAATAALLSISRTGPTWAAMSRRSRAPASATGPTSLQGVGVDHDGVVERRPAARRRPRRAWRRRRPRPSARPLASGGAAGGQGPRQHGGRPALGRREPDVAARQGQAVGLAHDGAADHLDRQREVDAPCAAPRPAAGSPSRRSRPGRAPAMVNSLATTVATPSKWPGRDAPSQASLDARTDTVVAGALGPRRVHLAARSGRRRRRRPASAHTTRSRSRVRG